MTGAMRKRGKSYQVINAFVALRDYCTSFCKEKSSAMQSPSVPHDHCPTPVHIPPMIGDLNIHIRMIAPAMHTARIQSHLTSQLSVFLVVDFNGVVAAHERVRIIHSDGEIAVARIKRHSKGRAIGAQREVLHLVLGVDEKATGYKVGIWDTRGNHLGDDSSFAVFDPLHQRHDVVWSGVDD